MTEAKQSLNYSEHYGIQIEAGTPCKYVYYYICMYIIIFYHISNTIIAVEIIPATIFTAPIQHAQFSNQKHQHLNLQTEHTTHCKESFAATQF